MNDELTSLIQLFLSKNDIDCDNKELAFQIQSHPSYPSLHAITGVLDHFNIDNIALDVPANEATLSQLPQAFLAQLKTDQGNEFVVAINKRGTYQVISSKKEKKRVSVADFLEQFTGIMVAVEKTEETTITKSKSKSLFFIISWLCAFLGTTVLYTIGIDLPYTIYLLISILGVYISFALIQQELGESSLLGDTFCPSTSTKTNCSSVLTSKGAQFGVFKLSDLSMSYFVGFVVSAFLLFITNSSKTPLHVISILAIPLTLYSIYYQYVVIKQWCMLCLSVVGVLWIQALLSFFFIGSVETFLSDITATEALVTGFAFSSAFVIWNSSSSKSKLIKELNGSKIQYFKFKRDFELFEAALKVSKTVDTHIPAASEIVLGNKLSNLSLTIITSPFCGHCKPVHTLVEGILKKYQEKVKITIRFNANSASGPLIDITSRLLELYHSDGEATCLEAMHDIYHNSMDTESWIVKWGNTANKAPYLQTLEDEYQWCVNNEIYFTPELLINNKTYPKAYYRDDLIYFIEDLAESYSSCPTESANHLEFIA